MARALVKTPRRVIWKRATGQCSISPEVSGSTAMCVNATAVGGTATWEATGVSGLDGSKHGHSKAGATRATVGYREQTGAFRLWEETAAGQSTDGTRT